MTSSIVSTSWVSCEHTCGNTASGGLCSMIVGIHNRKLVEKIGQMNMTRFGRSRLLGSYVSPEQPSVIDDPTIQSGFYGAPALCIVFAQKNFLFSSPDAFCCAETMPMEAYDLGISSCIVSRAEETFKSEIGRAYLKECGIPENYIARCFVTLGYCDGEYPQSKPRKIDRANIIE